jgi:cytochrome P450
MFASPETLDLAVEEFLRWTAPAPPTRNVTAEYMMVGDVPVPQGERVHCVLGAANRDPKYYPNPDEIDFNRPSKPHLAFGLGPHRCIGIHLARLEIKIAFEELRARMPRFTLDESRKPVGHLGFAWGIENVHLDFPAGKRLGG